ncbi:hypothetical protein [Rhizobium lusitanum]|uniref:hypothetical protein n=1 Tax=Rhizobium lusitanum TaxID=293958 RepID=UPI00195C19FD|nr:hypothetical protein [Rhizobium lusitanum]MBM7047564.1 hypothetical protein [Rhizobium lusitanum]
MIISESIIAAAHEGIEAQPSVSDIEKAARAIVMSMGFNPNRMAFRGPPALVRGNVMLVPMTEAVASLWTFFTAEAEAALNAVEK